jgi:2-phospho-L-lactate guanylyltransferase
VPTVVVPFRATGKSRLPEAIRARLARAMLADVVAASLAVGRVVVVTDDPTGVPAGCDVVADPGRGQGAAVDRALGEVVGGVLVVNADLPCATPEALSTLAAATGPTLVPARDGTTNALSLPDPSAFAPLYGRGSAARFAAAGFAPVAIPELVCDVDTVADLDGLSLPLGAHTRRARRQLEQAPVRAR